MYQRFFERRCYGCYGSNGFIHRIVWIVDGDCSSFRIDSKITPMKRRFFTYNTKKKKKKEKKKKKKRKRKKFRVSVLRF
jgi:hypothetical protein